MNLAAEPRLEEKDVKHRLSQLRKVLDKRCRLSSGGSAAGSGAEEDILEEHVTCTNIVGSVQRALVDVVNEAKSLSAGDAEATTNSYSNAKNIQEFYSKVGSRLGNYS